jgi:carnitine-CoA ligase
VSSQQLEQLQGMTPEAMSRRTVHGALRARVEAEGNRDFFRFWDEFFGYEDLDRASGQVAAGLQRLGVVKGDRVAILMGNRPEFLFLWFALSKLGAIEVPVNTAHRGDLLAYMVGYPECRFIVAEEAYLDRLEPVLPQLPALERVVLLDGPAGGGADLSLPVTRWSGLIDNDGVFAEPEVLWSDPFAILFTSGTTGPSKGSLLPHNYAYFMGEIVADAVQYDENDCLYNALPLFHGNAQLLSTMPALLSGARMVLAERFSASGFWPDIRRYGCTEFNYIGGILPILLKAEPRADDADNPLRALFGGGCPPDLFDEVEQRFGVTILEGYGMSEMGLPLLNTLASRKRGTVGRPAFGCEVKVVDDLGLEVPPGTAGEILMRPGMPFTMLLEYYNMPDKTVEAWRNLWFHTGDYGRMDEEGYFYFVDRKKDALRRRGENISSWEVERIINSHDAVLESAAIPVKSPDAEDEVMVCVALRPGRTLLPAELLDHCQRQMAYFMMPRYVRFMDALPKTPTEKVQKAVLREEGVTSDTWDREAAGYKVKR